MRLYTKNNTGAVVDPSDGRVYQTERDGALDVPDALGEHLYNTHFDGERVWETPGERSIRLNDENEAAQRDPAALLATMNDIRDHLAGKEDVSAADLADAAKAAQKEADRIQKEANAAQAAEDKKAKAAEAAAAKEKKAAEAAAKKTTPAPAKKTTSAETSEAKARAAETAKAAKASAAAAKTADAAPKS